MVAGIRAVVGGENSAYNILVEFQIKCQIDLLGDSRSGQDSCKKLRFGQNLALQPSKSLSSAL